MSLDTVLKIGNILRNSKEKMSFSNAVASCPKDNKGCWPFCLCLPVDKDFNIIFDKASIVPENQRNNLYYLKYKTSGNDTSCKYMFGDIYYSVKGTLGNSRSISISEDGNYRLAKSQSSFDKGNADYKSISSSLDFSTEETTELKQIRTGFGREQTMLERILKYAPAIIFYFENQSGSFKEYLDNEVNLKNICCLINKEDNKKKLEKLNAYKKDVDDDEEYQNFLLRLNYASIFIHFSYEDGSGHTKNWYDFSKTFELVTRKMLKEYVAETKGGLVLNKNLWHTICSGDKKNDIQFPKFDLENRYKTRGFTESDIEDLFYGVSYAKKGKMISGSEYKLIVLPFGKNLKADDLKLFIEKKNESSIILSNEYSDDLISSALGSSSTFTSFDFIFVKNGGTKPDTDLIEISNITRSALNRVDSRNKAIAHQVYAERNKEIKIGKPERNKEKKEDNSLSICKSFRNLLGDVQLDATGKVKIAASKKYESHILKVLPLIYKEDYYNDLSLLHSFVTNVESAIRLGGSQFWYKILKYDLMFILSIQNNKQNKYMEIINSASFKLGVKIGKMAKPLKKSIGSFEKNYVGLLSRRVSTKDDCIRFVTDISQKLVMHDGMWATMCAEVCDDLANLSESEYDKDQLSFGFLDGYFKYEPTDKKKDFQKRLERILADYSGNEDLKDEVSKLNLIVDEINHKN